MNIDPVQAAIAEAQAKVALLTAAQIAALPNTVATVPANTNVPAEYASPGRALTMDDPDMRGITVDGWIGVKEHGFLIGEGRELYSDAIPVVIDMKEVTRNKSIKFGNPPTYLKTYDERTCSTGGSWVDAIRRAKGVDPKQEPYDSADVPMTVVTDLSIKGKVVVEAGTRLGNSLSTTNWANFRAFYQQAMGAGLGGTKVKVMLGYQKRTNKNGNVWGVITFNLTGAA